MSDANSVLKRIGNYDLSGNRLGKGNFAYVELATNRATKTEVAIKVIDTGKISDERIKRCVLREASILRKINHPNVVRLYETLKQHSTFCIVTEFVPGGELLSFLRSQHESKLSESQARPIIRQLVSAVCYLHEHGIAHRGLFQVVRKNSQLLGDMDDVGKMFISDNKYRQTTIDSTK